MANVILFSLYYHINLTLYQSIFLYFQINLGHCLTLHNDFCVSIYCCARNKASFVADWINITLYTPLIFWSFSIFYFNYFIFIRVWCAFFESLSLFFYSCYISCLIFLTFLQSYPHLQMHCISLYLGPPKLVQTFSLCVLWLITLFYALNHYLLIVSASIHEHCHLLLYGCWMSSLLLLSIIFFFHLVNNKN